MALTFTNDILKFRESPSDPWEMLLIQANMNFNLIYPVGSIYMSTVNVDPGTIFGGTWEQLKDTFLLGAGDTYTAGDTGGEAEHTLLETELPKITGSATFRRIVRGSYGESAIITASSGAMSYATYTGAASTLKSTTLDNANQDKLSVSFGNDQAHNNMPPYIVVYMWKRLTLSPTIYTPPASVLIGDVASQDIVPVSMGGTGADNAADARTNIGALGLFSQLPYQELADANLIAAGVPMLYHFDANTLHTAFKEGAGAAAEGWILSWIQPTGVWGEQIAVGFGDPALLIRNLSSGVWSAWGRIT